MDGDLPGAARCYVEGRPGGPANTEAPGPMECAEPLALRCEPRPSLGQGKHTCGFKAANSSRQSCACLWMHRF